MDVSSAKILHIEVNPSSRSYRLQIEVDLKQTLMEHLHKHFAMKIFDHLEQPFADIQLDNFLVTLEGYPQQHKFFT